MNRGDDAAIVPQPQQQVIEEESRVLQAFTSGNEYEAIQILPRVQPGSVRKTFSLGLATLVTLIHLAAVNGWLNVLPELVHSYHCKVDDEDSNGRTALHYASYNGQLMMVKYLTTEMQCSPRCQDNVGWTPLMFACIKGHFPIVEYLMNYTNCSPSQATSTGWTSLHYACLRGHTHIVKYLLSSGKVNPMAENKSGTTPVWCASISNSKYDILKLFQPFQQCHKDFPVHSYTKVILTGYSGVGKTTIAKLVYLLATRGSYVTSQDIVVNVKGLTAGIIPLHIESNVSHFYNMIVYDFAGQQDYYSSHSAVLENIMMNSPAIFICIIDLSNSKEHIEHAIYYWANFIDMACCKETQLIIIGSHADKVSSPEELKLKSEYVQSIVEFRVKKSNQLKYRGFVKMDCRQSDTDNTRHFTYLLSKSQQVLQANLPSISYYCHVLYAYLSTKLKKIGCRLDELSAILKDENDSSLPDNPDVLIDHLTTLSDKGLILFLKNKLIIGLSWVVVKKEELLNEINGKLFAPKHFKEHISIASNTGIVRLAALQEAFPNHNIEMIIGFLQNMEVCQQLNSESLQNTNLKQHATTLSLPSSSFSFSSSGDLLFFPGFVGEIRPSNLTTPQFGWCLGCREPHQFFSTRFFHVLLLRVAFEFCLASRKQAASSVHYGLQRRCQVWQNGIFWKNTSGVSMIVEALDDNKWVVVLVSEKSRRAIEICSKVIQMILDLHEKLCSVVDVCECLLSPSLFEHYPFTNLPDTHLFDIRDLARAMLLREEVILDRDLGMESLRTEDAIPFEPYLLLSPSSVCQLFNSSTADQPVPTSLLQEVCTCCQQHQLKPLDYKNLRECVQRLSIFGGRNPLEVAELKEEDIITNMATVGVAVDTDQDLLSIDDLSEVYDFLHDVIKWKNLGLKLGIRFPTLEKIEQDCRTTEDCKMKMLSTWLLQEDVVPCKPVSSWSTLKSALRKIGEKALAAKILSGLGEEEES